MMPRNSATFLSVMRLGKGIMTIGLQPAISQVALLIPLYQQ